jgi:hypothetical protein
MTIQTAVMCVACIVGLASGPSALEAGAASVPPIEWSTLPLLFIGSAAALFLVLAFQVALKKERAFAIGWKLFAVVAVYFIASGVGAVGTAIFKSATSPAMFFILVIGLGAACGLWTLKATFASKLRSAI